MFEEITSRDLITIGISAAALALSYFTAMRASRLNRRQYELAKAQGEEGSRIAASTAESVREQARLQRDTDIIRWTSDVTHLLSEIAEFAISEGDLETQREMRHLMRYRLTAQIDIGRLYFPNSDSGLIMGDDERRPPAYRGDQQSVLDHLVAAYDLFTEQAITGTPAERRLIKWKVTAEKRGFVSEVHEFIDPKRYVKFRDDGEIEEIKAKIQAEAVESDASRR